MATQESLLAELEGAIAGGSPEKRVETLRRLTDLFLNDADRLNEAQIGVFDDVLTHLIHRIETKALAELGERLAPVDNAPLQVIQRLARDDQIAVAGPVLSQSKRLTTEDLVEIAETKGRQHLLAISTRDEIEEAVTDKLIERGDQEVVHQLARNAGARFSDGGFSTMVKSAETDESLAEKLGLRLDLPLRLLRDLLSKATEAVRSRLLSHAPPEVQEDVQRVLGRISNEVSREAAAPRDFTRAQEAIQVMQKQGRLNEAALLEFARTWRYEHTVAALAALCSASIDVIAPLMKSDRRDGLLVPCKAAGLKWPTVREVLRTRFSHHTVSEADLTQSKEHYLELSQSSAQRLLRFWQIRTTAQKAG